MNFGFNWWWWLLHIFSSMLLLAWPSLQHHHRHNHNNQIRHLFFRLFDLNYYHPSIQPSIDINIYWWWCRKHKSLFSMFFFHWIYEKNDSNLLTCWIKICRHFFFVAEVKLIFFFIIVVLQIDSATHYLCLNSGKIIESIDMNIVIIFCWTGNEPWSQI